MKVNIKTQTKKKALDYAQAFVATCITATVMIVLIHGVIQKMNWDRIEARLPVYITALVLLSTVGILTKELFPRVLNKKNHIIATILVSFLPMISEGLWYLDGPDFIYYIAKYAQIYALVIVTVISFIHWRLGIISALTINACMVVMYPFHKYGSISGSLALCVIIGFLIRTVFTKRWSKAFDPVSSSEL